MQSALRHDGEGRISVVLEATHPAPARLVAWCLGSGSYTGWYASWGEAKLYEVGTVLFFDKYRQDDTDGGIRDEDHEVWKSTDRGASWERARDVPSGAREIGVVTMTKET